MDINSIMALFSDYGAIILLLSGMIGGEEVIISLVFLSVMGLFPLWWVLVFVTLGELISDLFIFSLGRVNMFHKLRKIRRLSRLYDKVDALIIRVSMESTLLTLLYSKFIYGTRIFTLAYLGSKKTAWKRFISSEMIVLIVWMAITVSIGWIAGISAKQLSTLFKRVELAVTLLILIIILIIIVKRWVQARLMKLHHMNGDKR